MLLVRVLRLNSVTPRLLLLLGPLGMLLATWVATASALRLLLLSERL